MEVEFESDDSSTRKLATIQIIDDIEKVEKADALELATILGWGVVTKLNEVKIGQRIIFCEIDSLLPADAKWLPVAVKDRMKALSPNSPTFRVKTVTLRGQISQGLIISDVAALPFDINTLEVGDDVTKILGIGKYEPNVKGGDNIHNEPKINPYPFPDHYVDKTNEPRLQSNPKLLEKIKGQPYDITLKCDGTSATYLLTQDEHQTFLVCSRNQYRLPPGVDDPPDVYWRIAKQHEIERVLREHYPHYCIQGEICGPDIQKNLLGLKQPTFFVFNVVDMKLRSELPLAQKHKARLTYNQITDVCHKLGLNQIERVKTGDDFDYITIASMLLLADGKYNNTNNNREGIVVRSGTKYSFKVISNKYLKKNDY